MEVQPEFGIATTLQIFVMRTYYANAACSGLPISCTMIDHIAVFEAVSQFPIFMLPRAGYAEWVMEELFPFLKNGFKFGETINIKYVRENLYEGGKNMCF
jgi:hypothetical protein